MKGKEKILVVVAHPDDESLGAGGTISRFVKEGCEVAVMVLVSMARARAIRPDDGTMLNDQTKAMKALGGEACVQQRLPEQRAQHRSPSCILCRPIEAKIAEFGPRHHHHPST